MTETIAQGSVSAEDRIAGLEAQVSLLAARLEEYYRRACLARIHEKIFASTWCPDPPPLLYAVPPPASALESSMQDSGAAAILEASRR